MIRSRRRALDVSSGSLHPFRHVRVASDIEKPPKYREAISAPEPETGSEGSHGIGERTWVFIAGPDSISHHIRHRLGALSVIQEVGRDPRWPGDRQAGHDDRLSLPDCSLVKPDVGPAGLAPSRQREIVPVRRKMT